MRAIQYLLHFDFLMQNCNVGRLIECLRVRIPQLDNAEAFLRTHRDTDNRVFSNGDEAKCSGNQISLIGLRSGLATDFETVTSAANIGLVFPERRGVTLHGKHHSVHGAMLTHFAEYGTQKLPAGNVTDATVAVDRP